jgi:formate hydrogenlyase subunit 3/multisubunit Na+/H+ antiporter MnhD subunit
MPFSSAGLAVASLTLGGLPLLATFPIRQVLMQEVARSSLPDAIWALARMVGLLFSTFRALAVLVRGPGRVVPHPAPPATSEPATASPPRPERNRIAGALADLPIAQTFCETRTQIVLLVSGGLALLIIGLFPQAFSTLLNGLFASFPQLP